MPEETARPQKAPLSEELEFYSTEKNRLLETQYGKYALIKGHDLIGTFDTDQDAYKIGLERFGNIPFLIIQIIPESQQKWIPTVSLGLLHARL